MTGLAFAKNFLNRQLFPQTPTHESFQGIDVSSLSKISKLFNWVVAYKFDNPDLTPNSFLPAFTEYLKENKIPKRELFPLIRKLLSQEHSLPMYRIFYYSSMSYLSGCLVVIMHEFAILKNSKKDIKIAVSRSSEL